MYRILIFGFQESYDKKPNQRGEISRYFRVFTIALHFISRSLLIWLNLLPKMVFSKTSPTQFEMMVTFMEQYGDLTKPSNKPRGRITTIQRWEELTVLLNSDGSGDSRTTEKWKKVWSDLKNNTKRKFGRINKAASGTGGGPASTSKLTDLEVRVLNIMGELAATGLKNVSEAGLSQHEQETPEAIIVQPEVIIPPLEENEEVLVYAIQEEEWNEAGGSHQPHVPPPATPPAPTSVPSNEGRQEMPATEGQSPRRSIRRDAQRRSPRRRPRIQTTALQEATQHFLHSDEEWRNFLRESHKDKVDNEKERLRLREIELQVQQQWQGIFHRLLDALHKIIDSKLVEKE